ncbi:type VII secretion target [Actinosynnema sp. CS-041913]|uniref:type VII secretion target n=1 Tax=Actinosynnema sp. CS-041913 TaxID=3239917 RepID=UPI003D939F92
MSGKYDVAGSELRGHADRLRGVGDKLGGAVATARQSSLSAEAFGKVCTMFPPIVRSVGDVGVQSLVECLASVDHIVEAVRDTANIYDGVDEGDAAALRGKGQ